MTLTLQWPGKAEAQARAEAPPPGCLVPGGPPEGTHRLIAGDNLPVLGHLAEELTGAVRLIYIDPPYNTGRDFLFRDKFGRGEDRHSAWLSFMLPRLLLARRLLHPEGVLFVSIDDREVHRLRLLLDEVFGAQQAVATVVWQKVFAPKNSARHFSADHEYVLVYAAHADRWRPNLLPRTAQANARYKNPDQDPRGPWASDNLCARNPYKDGVYPVVTPAGRRIEGPPPGTYWRVSEARFRELHEDGRIWWGPRGNNQPRLKRFLSEVKEGRVPQTLWTYREVGHTQQAKKELLARVEVRSPQGIFDTPKPLALVERIVRLATEPHRGDWVLDFFAGSGTTGEAVWRVNAEDGGNRRVCLVELDQACESERYATLVEITAARLRRAAQLLGETHPQVDTSLARWAWRE